MKNTPEANLVGKKVLGLELGLATITGVESIEGEGTFYIIEKYKENMKRYYPTKGKLGFRLLSSKDELISSIEKCQVYSSPIVFETRSQRIKYFKRESRNQDIQGLFRLFRTLTSLKTLNSFETSLLNKLTGSLITEISLVFKVTIKESKNILRPLAERDS